MQEPEIPDPKRYPTWVTRVFCALADSVLALGIALATILPLVLGPFVLMVYYLGFEMGIGRTPGKWVHRLEIVTTEGERPSRKRLLWRNVLRLLGPFAMLSRNRVTLLDWLSGCRVVMKSSDKDTEKKIRKGWR